MNPAWIGHRVTETSRTSPADAWLPDRLGEGMLPGPDTVFQEGDLLHLATWSTTSPSSSASWTRLHQPDA